MPDIIHLLPDSVANQIAAGEVVQRPASAVKELIENALDAGADKIQLIIKDAGKALIQIVDNGCGMSVTDARMSLERHATSKIRKAEDLFAIRTMGFRGEAMASIAAISQMEIKTRRHEDELGTFIEVEGSNLIKQEPCACPAGTSIGIKNLFYNIPARRNFLKGNSVEMKHILDEFQRNALANPSVHFTLHHDGEEVLHLPSTTLKQRILHLLGNNYNEKLVPIDEQTSIINIKGFIGKPNYAKRTRGDQFFFVNNRFVKDAYLNHAVISAYDNLLADDTYPLYVLFIEIDPAKVDINIHPTKTEVKYQDEKSIYAILRSAVKRSLGLYNITPSLNFDQETAFDRMITRQPLDQIKQPSVKFNADFNPFHTSVKKEIPFLNTLQNKDAIPQNWETLYEINKEKISPQIRLDEGMEDDSQHLPSNNGLNKNLNERQVFQIHKRFIASQIKSGLMIIEQQAAHERILYERFLSHLENHQGLSQQTLFPQTISLNAADFSLASDLLPDFTNLGFQIRIFGTNTLVIEGVPADIADHHQIGETFEQLLEEYKNNVANPKISKRDNLAKTLAKNAAIKAGQTLENEEMNMIIDQLFACDMPNVSISGKQIIVTYSLEELIDRFNK